MKITNALLIFSIFLLNSMTSFAQWSTDPTINNPISIGQNDQYASRIVSDGSGGAIIFWNDKRNGTSNVDIYAQHIDSNGVIQWTTDGIAVCTAINNQENIQVISDGNGGAIITWNDYRNSTLYYDIYAQKINSAGVVQWSNNGVAICTASENNYNPKMVTDGNGGAIITWMDTRTIINNGDIYAQSINSSGIIQWAIDGVIICDNISQNDFPDIASDGNGGAIITWMDTRTSPFDIYAQRINSTGIVQWTNNGVVICNAVNSQSYPSITSSNNGGAIITWTDSRSSTNPPDIYAQHINSNGTVQWTNNGVPICTSAASQNSTNIISDGNGGAIIAWTDYRTTANSADIFAQRVNSSGVVQWTTNGVGISRTTGNQWLSNITTDGNGGAILTWQDQRVTNSDIYSQRIDSNGIIRWTSNGVPVSTATDIQGSPYIASDENGGAIIAWGDYRSGTNYDVYAQRINTNGTLSVENYDNSNNSFVKISPNPSNGLVTVQSTESITEFYLINPLGEIIHSEFSQNNFNLTLLSKGVYIYKAISDNNSVSVGKIIITN